MRHKLKTTVSSEWLRLWVFPWQIFHLAGSAVWNIAGVILISQGQQSLGPTASVTVAAVLLLLGIGLWFGHGRIQLLYLVISVLLGVAATLAIKQAIVGDASDWPSELWRWVGAVLNFVGFVSNFTGVVLVLLRQRKSRVRSHVE